MPNKPSERDADILKHIIKYCDELEEAFQVFGDSEETFVNNSVFKKCSQYARTTNRRTYQAPFG